MAQQKIFIVLFLLLCRYLVAIPPEWQSLNVETDWELTYIAQALIKGEPNVDKFKGIFILPVRDPNAFVSEDGYLIITEGFLELLNGRDGIAFALGHELTHLLKGHSRNPESNPSRLERIRTELERGLGGSIVGTGLQILLRTVSSYYDREREREADEEAVRLMAKAGFDLNAAQRVLSLFRNEQGFLSWFRSHPFLAERLDIVQKAIRKWKGRFSDTLTIVLPPDYLPEVFVELKAEDLDGNDHKLWADLINETQQWLWSALMDVTSHGKHSFRPVRLWQRYRANVLTVQIKPINWQISSVQNLNDWKQWQVRMKWQLKDKTGKILSTNDERIVTVFMAKEPFDQVLFNISSTLAKRIAKFVLKAYKSEIEA